MSERPTPSGARPKSGQNDQVLYNPGPPERWLLFAEVPRALAELAGLGVTAPFLSSAPRGDGHAVLVFPGLSGSDRATRLLRRYLDQQGYATHPWGLGRNLGPWRTPGLSDRLTERLQDVFADAGSRKVSLVGWSLGGIYARLLARKHPERVRQVITLGSPIGGSPRATRVYPLVELMNRAQIDEARLVQLRILGVEPLPVPTTAIFSKSDGIVPWQIAMQAPSARSESIEVYGSHLGLGVNPAVLFAVADRLAQPQEEWSPFTRSGWRRWLYGPALAETQ
jgi:pimeloyl-ACP methyl ester carboxylesterase